MKVAIMTDDNSGMSREEAAGLGIFMMPMPFFINGELTYQSETFTRKDFYNKLAEGADVSTSQPSPGDVMDMTRLCTFRCPAGSVLPVRVPRFFPRNMTEKFMWLITTEFLLRWKSL